MLRNAVSAIALSAGLGLSPALTTPAFAQDNQTAPAPEQPAVGQEQGAQQGTTTTTEGTTTTQTPPTETTIESVEGEEAATEGQPVPGQIFEQNANQFLGSTLMDATVQSTEGEGIGEVTNIIVTPDGRVEGVVVGVGGFLGIGQKDVAVQMNQITIQLEEQGETDDLIFVLNATREQLEAAPEFRTQAEAAAEQAAEDPATAGGTAATDPAPGGAVTTDPAAGGGATTTTPAQPAEGQSQ
jgi:hypothetical protein